jgi:glucokinase-like ROK family protein
MSVHYPSSPFQHVRNLNKHTALDLIRFTPGGISRVALAERLALSRAAVTSIAYDLLGSGIVQEGRTRSKSSGGRPPITLEVNPRRGYVLGIDMGATHLAIILANFAAQIVHETETSMRIGDGPQACIAQADEFVRELLANEGLTLADIAAVGLSVPGPIVSEEGMVIAPPIMPGWDRFPIRDTLESMWGCPVSLNNDAEVGALGEWAHGAGRGERDLAYIKVGTGIGAGLLLDGQIYRGSTGSAGEIGHLTIDESGPLCDCGNTGCLEALAGGKAIGRQAREAVSAGPHTLLAGMGPPESLTAHEVATAARRGDLVAQQIVTRAGNYLGVAIAGLVNLFNPSMVVVGGGVAQIGDLFLQPIRDAVHRRSLPAAARSVRITTAVLGRQSSSMGAVVEALNIALHQIAEGPRLERADARRPEVAEGREVV